SADAKLEAAKDRHAKETAPLKEAAASLRNRINFAGTLRDRLRDSADPALIARAKAADAKAAAMAAEIGPVQADVARLEVDAQRPDIVPTEHTKWIDGEGNVRFGPHPLRVRADKELPAARARLDALLAKRQAFRDDAES